MAELDRRRLCARILCSEGPALGVWTVLPIAALLSDHRAPLRPSHTRKQAPNHAVQGESHVRLLKDT